MIYKGKIANKQIDDMVAHIQKDLHAKIGGEEENRLLTVRSSSTLEDLEKLTRNEILQVSLDDA